MVAANMMRPQGSMAAMMSTPQLLGNYVNQLRAARKVNVRQGNVEPVTGTVRFVTAAGGVLAAGLQRTAFLDNIGEATSSGLAQTAADGTLFGGKIPSGEVIVLRGMGLSVESDGAFTAQDVEILGRNLAVQMQLRRTPVLMGSVRDWPDFLGPRGVGNGNNTDGVIPFTPAVVLEPLQDFTMLVTIVRPITLSLALTAYDVHFRFPDLKLYDPMVLGKS